MAAGNTHQVFLALGSNLGNKEENIRCAIENIDKRIGSVTAVSAFYITSPQGFASDNMFVNAACKIATELSPLQVLEYTQVIEREMGRTAKSENHRYADRIIDIDILLYDGLIFEYPQLIIPHPFMHERHYVLNPLAEIASEVVHPVLGKTIGELKRHLP